MWDEADKKKISMKEIVEKVKEICRTLKEFNFSQEKINYAIDYASECCIVIKNISKSKFSKYIIQDKNDIIAIS